MVAFVKQRKKLSRQSLEKILQYAYAFADGWGIYQIDVNSEDNDEDYFALTQGFNEALRLSYHGAEYDGSSIFLIPEHCDTPMEFTMLVIGKVSEEI